MKFRLFIHSPGASQVVLVVRNPSANAGDIRDFGLVPESERSPGGGHGNPLQCSCLKNPMEPGRHATVLRIANSQRQLKQLSAQSFIHLLKSESESVTCSVISNSVIPSAIACQAPLSMGFSRQEYWKSPHLLKDILFAFKFWQL